MRSVAQIWYGRMASRLSETVWEPSFDSHWQAAMPATAAGASAQALALGPSSRTGCMTGRAANPAARYHPSASMPAM